MKIKLKRAIMHKGQELEVLDMPLEELTGNDLIEAEKQIVQSGEAVVVTDFSRPYLIAIAARAAHIPVETLKFMDARDFTRIAGEVRNFLIVQDSEDSTEETIPATSPVIS
jgi:hypothetical protein